MKVRTIGVPLQEGCQIEGSRFACEALEKKGIHLDKVVDVNRGLDTRSLVADACAQIKEYSLEAHDEGEFPLVIGGDHSLAIGSIASTMQVQMLQVLWIDAHTDINTPEASITKRIHGMPVAAVMGEGYPELVDLMEEERLGVEDIVMLGIRSMDPFEEKTIHDADIHMVKYDDIKQQGLMNVLEECDEIFDLPVHISLDLDVMNPNVCCGVNTPVEGGFSFEDIMTILEYAFDQYDVVSMDIVEFNPLNDDGKTILMVERLIEYVKQRVAEKNTDF
ncbi:MAG: arginase family protein [Erysipelotrichaceae bacterium]|nr:arginase family protein [Erysipelotrichaceae bacterium]